MGWVALVKASEEVEMCDYSLEIYGSRPAREGERYVTSRFPSGTIGLTSPEHASTAVCLNCDTALAINNIPDSMCRDLGLKPNEDAVFIRLDTGTYRDGVRFSNGAEVSLQKFPPGVGFAVKQLLENMNAVTSRRSIRELIGLS
jgi:hypothetical protein